MIPRFHRAVSDKTAASEDAWGSKPEGFEVSNRVRFAPRSGRQSGHAGWSRSCHQPTSEPAVPLLAGSTRGLNRLSHPPPTVIRVKTRHARSDRGRARTEVHLVDVPMMTDEKCHQAGNAILRRIGHEGEPADHVAAHHVVDFAAR